MIEKVIKVPGHKDPVHLKFSCGKCIVGHRTAKCNHYAEFLEGKRETTHRERFYLIKKNGKKPNRPVAFLYLQVIPKKFTINDSETPRCQYFPEKYCFQCKQNCCDGRRKMFVNEFVDLQVRHTELNMLLFRNVDPIPLVGSKAAREAYRLWHFLSHMDWYIENGIDALHLPRVFSKDDKESWGTDITSLVRDFYGFDAVEATANIREGKTPTKFKQCLKYNYIVDDEIEDERKQAELDQIVPKTPDDNYQFAAEELNSRNWLELGAFPINEDDQKYTSTELNTNTKNGTEQAITSTLLIDPFLFKEISVKGKLSELDDEEDTNTKEQGNRPEKHIQTRDFIDVQDASIVRNQSFNGQRAIGQPQIETQIFLLQHELPPPMPVQLDAPFPFPHKALNAQILTLDNYCGYPQADDYQQPKQFQQPEVFHQELQQQITSQSPQKYSQTEQANVKVQRELLNREINLKEAAFEGMESSIMKNMPITMQNINEQCPIQNTSSTLLENLEFEQTLRNYSENNEGTLRPSASAKATSQSSSSNANIKYNCEPIADFVPGNFFNFSAMVQADLNSCSFANGDDDTIDEIYAQIFTSDLYSNN